MFDIDQRTPLLVLNIQINESESERINIFGLSDIEDKVDLFCKNYQIKDKNVVKKIKARIRLTLSDRYPFLVHQATKVITNNNVAVKPSSKKNPTLKSQLRPRKLAIDTSVNKPSVSNLIYAKKAKTNTLAKQAPIHRITNREMQLFSNPSNPSKLIKKRTKVDKENHPLVEERPATDYMIKYRPTSEIALGYHRSKNYLVSAIHNSINLSTSAANAIITGIPQQGTPQNPNVKVRTDAFADVDLELEARKHLSNYSQAKLSYKSSICEPMNHPDISRQSVSNSRVHICETRIRNEILHDRTNSIKSFNKSCNRGPSDEHLREIFEKLDYKGSGLVGPRNINLRSLSADNLRHLEDFIIEIFKKEQDWYMNFTEFCSMTKQLACFD